MLASDPYLRDLWYLAGHAKTLKPGAIERRILLGEPVLLARRKHDGQAFALRDVCPHRGVPLAARALNDDGTVTCPYHGWRFGADGLCAAIPSLVDGQELEPHSIRVRTYPLREQDGLLWIYMPAKGREAAAPNIDPPKIPLPGNAVPKFVERQLFRCDLDRTTEGLMDPAHGPYVHKAWFWRSPEHTIAKAKAYEPTLRGFTMMAHKPSANSTAYKVLGTDLSTEIKFELPSIRTEHIRAGKHSIVGLTTCTPISESETEVTHTMYWTLPWLSLAKPALRVFAGIFMRQDREIVELQQEWTRYDPRQMLIPDADIPAIWYHKLKKAWASALETGVEFANPVQAQVLRWRS
jgi:phenylpropionate dioxygenase-like ring-hydroxylating dioxygenase large terminal subunit